MQNGSALKQRKAFTVIEVAAIALILAVIALILAPFVKETGNLAKQNKCIDNLREISLALRVYALENEKALPAELKDLVDEGYLSDDSVFNCPFTKIAGNKENPDYKYIKPKGFGAKENLPMVYDKEMHHYNDRSNVLYINGEIINTARWPSS